MKVEKIIIEKELMEIPDHYCSMEFYKFKGEPHLYAAEEMKDLPPFIDFETETYQVVRVYTHDKQKKNYLVKVDERGLFEELIEITNMLLKGKVIKAANIIVDIKVKNERKRIASLPWWKRLLNRLD